MRESLACRGHPQRYDTGTVHGAEKMWLHNREHSIWLSVYFFYFFFKWSERECKTSEWWAMLALWWPGELFALCLQPVALCITFSSQFVWHWLFGRTKKEKGSVTHCEECRTNSCLRMTLEGWICPLWHHARLCRGFLHKQIQQRNKVVTRFPQPACCTYPCVCYILLKLISWICRCEGKHSDFRLDTLITHVTSVTSQRTWRMSKVKLTFRNKHNLLQV